MSTCSIHQPLQRLLRAPSREMKNKPSTQDTSEQKTNEMESLRHVEPTPCPALIWQVGLVAWLQIHVATIKGTAIRSSLVDFRLVSSWSIHRFKRGREKRWLDLMAWPICFREVSKIASKSRFHGMSAFFPFLAGSPFFQQPMAHPLSPWQPFPAACTLLPVKRKVTV